MFDYGGREKEVISLDKLHVTLINPPQVFTKTQLTAGVVPPLGILYLSSYLKKFNINVDVIDSVGSRFTQYTPFGNVVLRGMSFKEIVDGISENTELIGISALYSHGHLVIKELIRLIKLRFPHKLIALGGAHVSVLPEFVLRDTDADIAVIGEGEITLLELCENLADYQNVLGIAFKKDEDICFNPRRPLISNLDSLPIPDRDFVNMSDYFKASEPHGCSASGRWTTILSSRGCPYNCTFCTTPQIWQRRWRYRSPSNVVSEMIELNSKFGINDFHFEDENMGFNKRWMHEFCQLIIDSKLKITWQPSNGLRVETILDSGLLEIMKRSGCTLLVFTLESASERVRNKIINKKLDISNIEKAVRLANKVGINSTCYFMLGLPGEKFNEAESTIDYSTYLARIGLDETVISIFSMLPGCKLFNEFYNQGKIKLNEKYFHELLSQGDMNSSKSWTDYISDQQLKKLRTRGYMMFAVNKAMFHPIKTIKSIANILKGTDALKSERVVRTFIRRLSTPSY